MSLKKAIICKQVNDYQINEDLPISHKPQAGDVALFEVLEIGKHTRLQCEDGKNHHIYTGDKILAAFGTRYATNQLEGYVPDVYLPEYHILGQGGVIGELKSIHKKFEQKGPTTLKLIGFATNQNGDVINTKYLTQKEINFTGYTYNNPKIILSIGGSMDSGKTTTAGFLCKGISNAGKRVCFTKLTGTVYSKDTDFVLDCGANYVNDFSTFGFPSTYMCEEQELLNLYQNILQELSTQHPEYIVVEIADGLLQRETNFLLKNRSFMQTIDAVIYSDGSSTGALSGLYFLEKMNIKPFALCGVFTAAPLLINEVKQQTTVPVLTLEDLSQAQIINYFENPIQHLPLNKAKERTMAFQNVNYAI